MNEKWVEQVEKSFLWNEGGCRDVSAWKRKETRRCLHQDTNSFITPSLHLCFFQVHNVFHVANSMWRCFFFANAFTTNKQNSEQRCRDGVMNEFVSWCRHLLVSFLFHALTSLHPPSFHRNDFSTCIYTSIQNVKGIFMHPVATYTPQKYLVYYTLCLNTRVGYSYLTHSHILTVMSSYKCLLQLHLPFNNAQKCYCVFSVTR